MPVDRRRAILDAFTSIPPRHRAWLELPPSVEGFELFCFFGWGVVPNDAQLEAVRDILTWPEGTFHLWRWANRTGKTTGLMLVHLYFVFVKWRYISRDFDSWLGYKYKTLHAAPQGILMAKAWEIADAMIAGSAIIQRDPFTMRQRRGIFVGTTMFEAGTENLKDGTTVMVVRCANGAQVDFLQTYSGAGRMESDAWWFICWDEFGEHQPVDRVPDLLNTTFLPRSSDFMAPVVLSSTEKEHNAVVYMELEDIAERSPADWNLKEFGRSVNFAQSRASIERQMRMSTDEAAAQRSVMGGAAEGGKGSLLPRFTLDRAFDPRLPGDRRLAHLGDPQPGKAWRLVQTFDHAIAVDRNVVTTAAVQWPVLSMEELIAWPVQVLDVEELRSSRVLTPDEQTGFAARVYRKHERDDASAPATIWLTDTTGEGGIMVHRMLRSKGVPTREYNFTARVSKTDRRTRKGHGRTGLQRLFSLGLPMDEDGTIILPSGVDPATLMFGGIRIPLPSTADPGGPEIRRMWKQLAMLRVDDEKLVQDHAMTLLMLAGFLYPYIERPAVPRTGSANPFGTRARRFGGLARVR